MVYARCLYCVAMWADTRQRSLYAISRSTLNAYLKHACILLRAEMLSIGIDSGYVIMLIDLNADISISAFTDYIKSWTSAWITADDGKSGYWAHSAYSAVSPEDSAKMASLIGSACPNCLRSPVAALSVDTPVHHIILLTSRFRLLIPLKYRNILAELTADVARSLNTSVVAVSAMRNHVHLLCGVPADKCISQFIHVLKGAIFERSQANRHLRCIEDWSEHAVAYTVAPDKIIQEEHDVLDQEAIHWYRRRFDEMSPLYQRLGIPYVASLH